MMMGRYSTLNPSSLITVVVAAVVVVDVAVAIGCCLLVSVNVATFYFNYCNTCSLKTNFY